MEFCQAIISTKIFFSEEALLFNLKQDIPKEKWNNVIFNIKLSRGPAGFAKIWINGIKVSEYSGPTGHLLGESKYYFKLGLYRDLMKVPMTMFIDDYWRGGSETCKIVDKTVNCPKVIDTIQVQRNQE